MRDDCPQLRANAQRELARAEREKRQELYRVRQEEKALKELQHGIQSGQVAVGSDGKTVWL